MGSHDAEEELQIRVMELEAEVERLRDSVVRLNQELDTKREESERLRAEAKEQGTQDFTHVLHRATLAEAENERLRAQALSMTVYAWGQEARIEAALSIAENCSLQTTSASVIGEMVDALKGE